MKHELVTKTDREIGEIEALIAALQKRNHWLRQASDWKAHKARNPATADQATRFYLSAMRQADYYKPEALRAAYRLFEIDAIHDAYGEACQEQGIDPDDSCSLAMQNVRVVR